MNMMNDSNTKDSKEHEERPIPDNLERIGMGLDCVECGNPTSWLPCWNCSGEGGWDGEELIEEDPLWYDIDDYRRCDECRGKGGWNYCIGCRKIVKVAPPLSPLQMREERPNLERGDSPGVCRLDTT